MSYHCIDGCNGNPPILRQCSSCWFLAIYRLKCVKSFISETLSPFWCRQERLCSWISFSKEGNFGRMFIAWASRLGILLSQLGSKLLEFGNFLMKTSVWDFSWRALRIFLLIDERDTWIAMGLVIPMTMRFLSHIYVKEKIRQASWPELCDSGSRQSATWCSRSRVETEVELTEPPCSPVLVGTKGVGKVSCSSAEPKCTDLLKKRPASLPGCLCCYGKSKFKEVCIKLFNYLIGLSLTCTGWLCNTGLTQLRVVPCRVSSTHIFQFFVSL